MSFFLRHKRLFIILGVIIAIFLIALILSFTLFGIKTISINFKSDTNIYNSIETENELIFSMGKYKGGSVFFANKDDLKKKIEKENPYIKIINIETVFPSELIIHCVEREEVFTFEYDNKYLVCDGDLKVLRFSETNDMDRTNPVLIHIQGGLSLEENLDTGNFISIKSFGDERILNMLTNIMYAFRRNSRGTAEVKALFTDMELKVQDITELKLAITFTDYNGYEIEIRDVFDSFENKLQTFFATYSLISPNDYDGMMMIIMKDSNGEIKAAHTTKK